MTKSGPGDRWHARAAQFCATLALVNACGGKAKEDAPSAPWEPNGLAGEGGEADGPGGGGRTDSGSSGSSSASGGATAGKAATAGGTGAGGTGAGTTSTGGKPVLGEPVYFKRGSARLSPELFGRTLGRLFDVELDSPLERAALAFVAGVDPKLGTGSDAALVTLAQAVLDAVSDAQLARAVGCDDTSSACRDTFVDDFAERAWRRPLDDAEIAALQASFARSEPGGELATLRRVVFEVISSPNAYFLRQMGSSADDTHYLLDGYELASLISYGVAGEPPDDELRKLAADNALEEAEQRVEQVERLLSAGPRQRPTPLESMIRDWLWIREAEDLPSFRTDPDLARAMLEETGLLIADLLSNNAPIAQLLNADYSFVNAPLAELYGLDVDLADDTFARVELGATPRRGIFHHASWLTSSSWGDIPNYARRGAAVAGVLCFRIPREPPNASTPPPAQNGSMSGRERYAAAVSGPACAGCHALIDPIGYGFDHFDSAGAYRETDAGAPIETSGEAALPEPGLNFESSTDLVEGLATDPRYTSCFVQRSAESWVGTYGDPAATDYASREMERDASTRIVDIFDAWVSSDHFALRVR